MTAKRSRRVGGGSSEATAKSSLGGSTLADEPVEPVTLDDAIDHALMLVVVPDGEPRSLPDTYRDLTADLLGVVHALQGLHADSRFRSSLGAIRRRDLPLVVNAAVCKLLDIRDVLQSDDSRWAS